MFFGFSFQIFHQCQISGHSPTYTYFHITTRLEIWHFPSKVNIIHLCYTCPFHATTTVFDRYSSIPMKVQGTVHSQEICLHMSWWGDKCVSAHMVGCFIGNEVWGIRTVGWWQNKRRETLNGMWWNRVVEEWDIWIDACRDLSISGTWNIAIKLGYTMPHCYRINIWCTVTWDTRRIWC